MDNDDKFYEAEVDLPEFGTPLWLKAFWFIFGLFVFCWWLNPDNF